MSIWKELYDIFDKERARWHSKNANKQSLIFEIENNLAFLADAIPNKLNPIQITNGLERSVFDKSMESGFSFNSISKNKKVTINTIGDIDEFKKYVGKDTEYLVKNAYLKISSLIKLANSSGDINLDLKFKSLFRFLMLLVAHVTGRHFTRRSSKAAASRAA
jgi:hypothetical protein